MQCWEREVNCGGREGNRKKRKEEERNSKSPVQMEATPPKASPASWSPSPLRELSSHRHTALGGTLFHGATKKLVLPNPPALREEIELRLLLWR